MTRKRASVSEFSSDIASVRALEDCIRVTRRYTEGIGTLRQKHPIQGAEFPSKTFCKYYEVYPETEIHWNMPVGTALDWLWKDVPCVDVLFYYDYRVNKAKVVIKGGVVMVKKLTKAISGFGEALDKITSEESNLVASKKT